jgi:hypothetical protein
MLHGCKHGLDIYESFSPEQLSPELCTKKLVPPPPSYSPLHFNILIPIRWGERQHITMLTVANFGSSKKRSLRNEYFFTLNNLAGLAITAFRTNGLQIDLKNSRMQLGKILKTYVTFDVRNKSRR